MTRFVSLIQSWWKIGVMLLLYVVAIVWHSLHPMASILSGRLNHPLTPYVDENSIDAAFSRAPSFGDVRISGNKDYTTTSKSLCEALQNGSSNVGISCFALPDGQASASIEIAQIVPIQAPVSTQNEALVVVLPYLSSGLNRGGLFVSFLQHLAERPWLAKTILVVAPTSETQNLTHAVDTFLDLHAGTPTSRGVNTLPRECAGSTIRQLFVLDSVTLPDAESPHILISPSGYRGVMPNMDLYSVAYKTFTNYFSSRMIRSYPVSIEGRLRPWKLWFRQTFPNQQNVWINQWWDSLMDWISWEAAIATTDKVIPTHHSSALDRGIDALTLQAVNLEGATTKKITNEEMKRMQTFFKCVEMVLHAFSNSHERLHHNTALFALPQNHGNAYVKHEEFLIPNILLLVPLIIRALTLFLSFRAALKSESGPFFDFQAVGTAMQLALGGTFLVSSALGLVEHVGLSKDGKSGDFDMFICQGVVFLCYVVLGWFWWSRSKTLPTSENAAPRQSLQLIACLLALYLQVGIAFSYVALAFPSALFWTPQIAFISAEFPKQETRFIKTGVVIFSLFLLLVTSPFLWIVPNVFATFTAYVKYVYTPLHLVTAMLWFCPP